MTTSINKRMTGRMDGEFVVFLIGMRVNKPWKIWKWLPVATAMPRMLIELAKQPELGQHPRHGGGNRPPLPDLPRLVDPRPDQEDDEAAVHLGADAPVDHPGHPAPPVGP